MSGPEGVMNSDNPMNTKEDLERSGGPKLKDAGDVSCIFRELPYLKNGYRVLSNFR